MKNKLSKFIPYIIALVVLVLGLSLIIIYQYGFGQIKIKDGDQAPYNIKAPKTIFYKSEVKTQKAKEKAKEEVEKVYRFDSEVALNQEEKTKQFFSEVEEIRKKNITSEQKNKQLKEIEAISISDDMVQFFVSTSDEEFQKVYNETLKIISDIYQNEQINLEEVDEHLLIINERIDPSLSLSSNEAIKYLVGLLLQLNMVLDEEEMQKEIKKAVDSTSPVFDSIKEGDLILIKGEKAEIEDIEKIEVLGLTSPAQNWQKTAGNFLLIIVLSFISVLYFYFFKPKKISLNKSLLIFVIFLLVTIFAARIILPFKPIFAYAFPQAAAVLSIAILLDYRAALISALIFSVFLGITTGGSFELTLVYLFSSIAGIYSIYKIERLNVFLKAAFGVFIASFLVSLAFSIMVASFSYSMTLKLAIACATGGILSGVLTGGLLTFLGDIFGITTFVKLLDLENSNQPLLKKLSLKAPGTYHHSILVSNIAERAAKACGANSLLVRVGALYHDIGKLENPSYFIENQKGRNIHQDLNPKDSAKKVIEHVEQGISMARKYRLPLEISEIISSHHGKSLVFYFYQLACKKFGRVNADNFRYSGPKPKTKEQALIMLADSIEAASRSISTNKKFSKAKLEKITNEIIDSKMEEGQLDESCLSLGDIFKIRNIFINTLNIVFHERIEYSEEETKKKKRKKKRK